MEKLCKEKNIKVDCKVMEEYIGNYNQPNEPLFTKVLCDFHVC